MDGLAIAQESAASPFQPKLQHIDCFELKTWNPKILVLGLENPAVILTKESFRNISQHLPIHKRSPGGVEGLSGLKSAFQSSLPTSHESPWEVEISSCCCLKTSKSYQSTAVFHCLLFFLEHSKRNGISRATKTDLIFFCTHGLPSQNVVLLMP